MKRVFARIIGDIGEIAINFAKRCSDGENDEHYIELGMNKQFECCHHGYMTKQIQ